MWDVKRQDLGVDIVVLPQRRLVVFHPDLTYAESLGALMATMPDMHPDVAKQTVEKVTPRPRPQSKVGRVRVVLATAIVVLLGWMNAPLPAAAGPDFGPDWSSATRELGLSCWGGDETTRLCRYEGSRAFVVRGYRHETGSLYVSSGPRGTVIFDFEDPADARHYLSLHPSATLCGSSTVVW